MAISVKGTEQIRFAIEFPPSRNCSLGTPFLLSFAQIWAGSNICQLQLVAGKWLNIRLASHSTTDKILRDLLCEVRGFRSVRLTS